MSEKHTMHWRRTNGDNIYIDDSFEKVMSVVSKILLDVVCTCLFIMATRNILFDVYEWSVFEYSSIIFMALIVSSIMEISFYMKKIPSGILRAAVLIVGGAVLAFSITREENLSDIIEGFERIAYLYVEDWNDYYNTQFYTFDGYQYLKTDIGFWKGETVYMAATIEAVVLVLAFFLLWLAKLIRKNIILIIIPIIALVAELLVGFSPEYMGLVMMLIGALISNAGPWRKPEFTLVKGRRYVSVGSIRFFNWGYIIIAAVILSVIVSSAGVNSAQLILSKADDMKQFAENIADKLEEIEFTGTLFGEKDSKTEKLDNSRPEFKYKDMLSVSINVMPTYNIYLKGYYANEYNDGVWTQDVTEFEDARKDIMVDWESLPKELAYMAVNKLHSKHRGNSLSAATIGVTIYVDYLEKSGKRAYTPYFAENYSEGIYEYAEGLMKKESDVDSTRFVMWQHAYDYESSLSTFSSVDKNTWEYDYEDFVEKNYLDVPDNLEMPKVIADEIRSSNSTKIENKITGVVLDNNDKLFLAELVAEWMQKNTMYSFYLDKIPSGVDPIDFFLDEGRKGYCMHYASASVMILRELGVPARYATGYLVKEENFENDSRQYTAVVRDSDAHAWVEIYLSKIGWVPYEVTKGFNADVISNIEIQPTQPTTEREEQPSTTKPQQEEKTTNEETKPEETTSREEKESSEIETTQVSGVGGQSKKSITGYFNALLKVFVIILVIVIIVEIIIKIKARQVAILDELVRKKRTKRAVRLINRRLYKRLKYKGKILKISPRDGEYEVALIETYSQIDENMWKQYMEIAKKAAFSNEELSVEDMMFCYEIYCKTKQKEEK